jgi:hypothetical protein
MAQTFLLSRLAKIAKSLASCKDTKSMDGGELKKNSTTVNSQVPGSMLVGISQPV